MRAVAVVLSALVVFAGCGSGSGGQGTNAPQPFGTRPATEVLKDGLILAAVKAAITAADPDSATTVGVAVGDAAVTLRGSVHTAAARAKVVAAARGVKGVTSVADDLRISAAGPHPKERFDDVALTARIETAITAQVGLQTHLGVHVRNGVVTLDGTVADAKTHDAVVAAARGTSGVRNVVDRVRVERT
ncbi:MAG TPA: BON domain-containing protein [Candidatus Baltobacteraceae bacterium]|nr:BON domain-containing protein [Candidatus Baltobacteraceae bacterium]